MIVVVQIEQLKGLGERERNELVSYLTNTTSKKKNHKNTQNDFNKYGKKKKHNIKQVVLPICDGDPGVVGGRVEHLELDGDIVSGLAAGRIEHMAGNGATTSSHDEVV